MAYKYPFIPDKRMYAAVMGACSYIRSTGYFNKAVAYYADKFGVSEEELAKHIRARQSAGQTGRKTGTGKKYKWFIVCETVWCEANGEKDYDRPEVLKGLSERTVVRRYSEFDWNRTVRADYGGSYAPVYDHEVIAQFDTEREAMEALPRWRELLQQRRGSYDEKQG